MEPQFGQTSELGGETAGGEAVDALDAADRRADFEVTGRARAVDGEVGVMVCTGANRRLVYITWAPRCLGCL